MKAYDAIHEIFEETARTYPEKIAIIDGDKKINYAELNERSNTVASNLKNLGIQSSDIVPIFAEKSINFQATLLGILKADATYLVLHKKHTPAVRKHILKTVAPKIICTDDQFFHELPDDIAQRVNIDNGLTFVKMSSEEEPEKENNTKESNLAYILYTSGTTGQPKGVMVSHENLLTIYKIWKDYYQLDENDIHLQMADPAFDVYGGDWIRTLLTGGCQVLCHEDTLLHPEALYKLIEKENISFAEFVPAILRPLLSYLEKNNKKLNTFRLLVCGSDIWLMGEYRFAKTFLSIYSRLVNSFGLTECAIDELFFEERPDDATMPDHMIVPIGKTFHPIKIQCVDENRNPVPPGEVGELVIGGPVVAEGYFNQPELTKKYFFTITNTDGKKERWFKTGDFVYQLPNGDIAMIGRNKNHIKKDGCRVDLFEVEYCLNNHPLIEEGIVLPVMADENHGSAIELDAFFKVKNDLIDYEDFITHFKDNLPLYAIPDKFYQVNNITLNANGKIVRDVAIQQENVVKRIMPTTQILSPKNDIEKRIVEIWESTLEKKVINTNHFFKTDLGGKSRFFVNMLNQASKTFQVNLPSTFQDCTVQSLSMHITLLQSKNQGFNLEQIMKPLSTNTNAAYNFSPLFRRCSPMIQTFRQSTLSSSMYHSLFHISKMRQGINKPIQTVTKYIHHVCKI